MYGAAERIAHQPPPRRTVKAAKMAVISRAKRPDCMRVFGRFVAEAASMATVSLIMMNTYRDLRSSSDVCVCDYADLLHRGIAFLPQSKHLIALLPSSTCYEQMTGKNKRC